MKFFRQVKNRVATWNLVVTVGVFCALVLLTAATATGQQHPTLVSVNSAGTGSGNGASGDFGQYKVTPDGRYVLFSSRATNLSPLDTIAGDDIYVRDLQTQTTVLVSVNAAGTAAGNGISRFGLISANGRYVAFTSSSSNLVAPTPGPSGVFLRDLQTATTRYVSINAAGTGGANGTSELIDMTPDGRFVTFSSGAQDLTSIPDGNGAFNRDIYVRDMLNNVTTLVTINSAGTASGNGDSEPFSGSISGDGRYVVFSSKASDLVPNDTSTYDVFLRDLQAGTTTRLSTNAAGTAGGNDQSIRGVIDRGGRVVVFATRATDLSTLPDNNKLWDLFIYDVQAGTNRLVTKNAAGTSAGLGFPPGEEDFYFDHGFQFVISDDARFVAFMSQLRGLVTNDTNSSADDVFRYEVATQKNLLVSVNPAGNNGVSASSFKPSISADGRFVAFHSNSGDLTAVATIGANAFVRDIATGQTYLASINLAGNGGGNSGAFEPLVTADGTRLIFLSSSSNLVTNDLNGFANDIFAFSLGVSTEPLLLTEENTQRAVALDSVTHTRDPFSLVNPFNFSSDQRTRVSLFVWRLGLLPGEDASALTAQADDEQGNLYVLPVEYAGAQSGLSEVTQVVVKLPESIPAPGDLGIRISLRGTITNRALIKIKSP